jgi:hypothetical protein
VGVDGLRRVIETPSLVGYLIFTVGLGIGDTDIFDWGGVSQRPDRHADR